MQVDNGTVYSNADHILDLKVVAEMKQDGELRDHPAYNFFGYIKYENGVFVEEIWRYGAPVKILTGTDIMDVIREANNLYGSE